MSLRKTILGLVGTVGIVVLAAPAAHAAKKMLIQPSPGFDASAPRTYAYVAKLMDDGTPQRELRPIDHTAMKEIDAALARLGWTRTDDFDESDVVVSYEGHADPTSRDGYVWFFSYHGTLDNYGGRTSLEGWITVTIVDSDSREELWRGTRLAAADATEENVRKAVRRTLRKILNQLSR